MQHDLRQKLKLLSLMSPIRERNVRKVRDERRWDLSGREAVTYSNIVSHDVLDVFFFLCMRRLVLEYRFQSNVLFCKL